MLRLTSSDEWDRGQIGQHIYMLLVEDADIDAKLRGAAVRLASVSKEISLMAIHLAVARAFDDGKDCLDGLMQVLPAFLAEPVIKMLHSDLADYGFVSFW